MRITGLTAALVRGDSLPDATRSDPSQEALILRISTDEGISGLAECNHTPEAVLGLLSAAASSTRGQGIAGCLLGADPEDREQLVETAYLANWHTMRRGLGLGLLHAVEVALSDIQARSRGIPLWQLLYGDEARAPMPYLTVYTGEGTFDETIGRQREMIAAAHELGYAAVKVEPLPECCSEERIGDLVRDAREVAGERMPVLVDFGYRFQDPLEAIRQIRAIEPYAPALVETPVWIDDVTAWSAVAAGVSVPIAGAEIIESEWELRTLVERGGPRIVQPWPNRVGIQGSLRVIAHAAEIGCTAVLGGWNATSIGNAATLHVAAGLKSEGVVLEHAPEMFYPRPAARIATPLPDLLDGRLPLPAGPGLSVELDEEAWAFELVRAPHVSFAAERQSV